MHLTINYKNKKNNKNIIVVEENVPVAAGLVSIKLGKKSLFVWTRHRKYIPRKQNLGKGDWCLTDSKVVIKKQTARSVLQPQAFEIVTSTAGITTNTGETEQQNTN